MNSVVVDLCLTTTLSVMYFAARRRRDRPGDTRNRERHYGLARLPRDRRFPCHCDIGRYKLTWVAINTGGSVIPASAALGAPCGLAQSRIIRSCMAFGIGVALPLPAMSPAPGCLHSRHTLH